MKIDLGATIRHARLGRKLSLRALAGSIGVTPSYACDIENDRRVPAEPVLIRIASELQLDHDVLMALAGRFSVDTAAYVKANPRVLLLVAKIARAGLFDDEIERLSDMIREPPKRKGKSS